MSENKKQERRWVIAEHRVILPMPLNIGKSDVPQELLHTFDDAKMLVVQFLRDMATKLEEADENKIGLHIKNNVAMLSTIAKED